MEATTTAVTVIAAATTVTRSRSSHITQRIAADRARSFSNACGDVCTREGKKTPSSVTVHRESIGEKLPSTTTTPHHHSTMHICTVTRKTKKKPYTYPYIIQPIQHREVETIIKTSCDLTTDLIFLRSTTLRLATEQGHLSSSGKFVLHQRF